MTDPVKGSMQNVFAEIGRYYTSLKFGLMVFYLFGCWVINLVIWFCINLVLWIRSDVPARYFRFRKVSNCIWQRCLARNFSYSFKSLLMLFKTNNFKLTVVIKRKFRTFGHKEKPRIFLAEV